MLGEYCLEAASSFQSLGSTVIEDRDEKEEIRRRIAAGNRAYSALNKILKIRLVRQSKMFRLYKTLDQLWRMVVKPISF